MNNGSKMNTKEKSRPSRSSCLNPSQMSCSSVLVVSTTDSAGVRSASFLSIGERSGVWIDGDRVKLAHLADVEGALCKREK